MWTAQKTGAPISFGNAVVGVESSRFESGYLFSFGGDKQFDEELEHGLEGLLSVAIMGTFDLQFRHIIYRQCDGIPWERLEATAVLYGKTVYLWGGRSEEDEFFHNSLLCFDTLTWRWSVPETTGDAPAPRIEHSAGLVNDTMYIFGGQSSRGVNFPNRHVYKFHLITRAWKMVRATGADVPTPRARAAVTVGTRIYVLDSCADTEHITISYFDTVKDTWVRLRPNNTGPTSRTGYCAWTYKGFVFMFGGSFLTDFSNEMWRYSPDNNTWGLVAAGGTVPPPMGAVCCAIIEDKVYIFGGAVLGRNGSAVLNNILHVFEYLPELRTLCIMTLYEHGLSPDWPRDRS